MIGNGFCGIHGRYDSTGGCPQCPLTPPVPVNIAAAPQVYPPQVWTGVTQASGMLEMTIFRERETYRDALMRIRQRISDIGESEDLSEALDDIGELLVSVLDKGTPE